MKKRTLSLYFAIFALFSTAITRPYYRMKRAAMCVVPAVRARYNCQPEEIAAGIRWLKIAPIGIAIGVLAGLGIVINVKKLHDLKKKITEDDKLFLDQIGVKQGSNTTQDTNTTEKTSSIKRDEYKAAKDSLLLGVQVNQPWLVENALKRGARATTHFEYGENRGFSVLDIAAKNGNPEIVSILLERLKPGEAELTESIETTDAIKSMIRKRFQQAF